MQKYQLTINATIQEEGGYNGRLQINETVTVNASSFLELAEILGRFHSLAQTLNNSGVRVGKT